MNKNIVFKALAIVFVLFMFSVTSFAKTPDNAISKIVIERAGNNDFIINLLFKDEYKGNAFLQKRDIGSYQVFLPETATSSRRTRVLYKNNADKNRIKLNIEEKPIIKGENKSKYVRIAVDMDRDYSIKLVSGLAANYNSLAYIFQPSNVISMAGVLLLAFALFILGKLINQARNQNTNNRCFTHYPASFLNSPKEYYKETVQRETRKEEEVKKNTKAIKQKLNIRNTIKPAETNTFDCFELPFAEDLQRNNNVYEFQSSLQQASKLLKEKPTLVKLRHTNPIARATNTNTSNLQMPAIEDVVSMPKKKIRIENKEVEKPSKAELLSVLNITPNKGFYLTTVDDTLALFGFINENVFLFKKFQDLSQINLQARFYDKNGKNDIYIVRLDSYKAMIEISEDSMKELAKI